LITSTLLLHHVGGLGDGSGLAHPVHPGHHDDAGLSGARRLIADLRPLQIAAYLISQGPLQGLGVRELLSGHFRLDRLNEGMGRLGAHVRCEEDFFQLLKEVACDLFPAEQQTVKPSRQVRSRL
jgi:hypothetical protein